MSASEFPIRLGVQTPHAFLEINSIRCIHYFTFPARLLGFFLFFVFLAFFCFLFFKDSLAIIKDDAFLCTGTDLPLF